MRWWYLKIKFKEPYQGKKIWWFNDCYMCDCKNLGFKTKEEAESMINEIKNRFQYPYLKGANIESITVHWSR